MTVEKETETRGDWVTPLAEAEGCQPEPSDLGVFVGGPLAGALAGVALGGAGRWGLSFAAFHDVTPNFKLSRRTPFGDSAWLSPPINKKIPGIKACKETERPRRSTIPD